MIGNGNYTNVDKLSNPANDAKLIAKTLLDAGFTLIGEGAQLNLTKSQFDHDVQLFGRALKGADVGLFYYSGHGMQVQGVNWLVPIDANPTDTGDLDFQMVDANLVLRQIENAGTKLNIMILDACRNNPFAVRGIRATSGGLAPMATPEGTLISYATQADNVAADGAGADSPYTAALAKAMRQPGLEVRDVFNEVGLSVMAATAKHQVPYVAASPLSGRFYFFKEPGDTLRDDRPAMTVPQPLEGASSNPLPPINATFGRPALQIPTLPPTETPSPSRPAVPPKPSSVPPRHVLSSVRPSEAPAPKPGSIHCLMTNGSVISTSLGACRSQAGVVAP